MPTRQDCARLCMTLSETNLSNFMSPIGDTFQLRQTESVCQLLSKPSPNTPRRDRLASYLHIFSTSSSSSSTMRSAKSYCLAPPLRFKQFPISTLILIIATTCYLLPTTTTTTTTAAAAAVPVAHRGRLTNAINNQQQLISSTGQIQQRGSSLNSNKNAPAIQTGGRMFIIDAAGRAKALMPGLLDESLLRRGHFSFGAKRVSFDRLKVLGNVYVKYVNGRPLRESYLFKSKSQTYSAKPN